MAKLNKFQRQVALTYGGGDYAHIAEPANAARWHELSAVAQSGDSLFQFIMNELADEGRIKMDRGTAVQRMENASNDIQAALWHVDQNLKG
jgi:hypothetical protein